MTEFYKDADCGAILMGMSTPKEACEHGHLTLLKADSVDASAEKHVPVASVQDGAVLVKVGSEPHPMTPEHHIEWIFVKTSFGGTFCKLEPGDEPEALLQVVPGEVLEVYEYCNLHGLWKAKEPVFEADFDQNTVACSPEFAAGCVDSVET